MVIVLAFVFLTGCGQQTKIPDAYDVYELTDGFGTAGGVGQSTQIPFFSGRLCVSEDVSIGTDVTDSQVAGAAGAFNLSTGNVIYAKNLYQRMYPASTTKILTAYLVLKYCSDLDASVTVSEHAADQASDSSVCNLKAGDVMRVRDLLYGMMLRSGNDAAIALAEYISGDEAAFAELMNQEAYAMGATHSHFVNSNGLPDENHYTTIYDMYLIFAKALENDTFSGILQANSYDVSYKNAQGEEEEQTWKSTNLYLTGETKAPEGISVVGGKTGTTGDAGYCLALCSFNASGEAIVSIVFKADGRADLYLLMNQILQGFAGGV